MANNIINIADAIERELTIYSTEITETIKNEAKSHMKQLVNETKKTAPVGNRQKHYKDNISSKKTKEDSPISG